MSKMFTDEELRYGPAWLRDVLDDAKSSHEKRPEWAKQTRHKRNIVVYVAGPFRPFVQPKESHYQYKLNIDRAEAVALEVWRAGFTALCPHAMTRHYQNELLCEVWLDGTLELMRRCDAVLVLQHWEESSGTKKEIAEAEGLKMPVFYSLADLKSYYEPRN